MINNGFIHLLDRVGEIIDGRAYQSPGKRNEIIKKWEKLYSVAYKTCFLQIVPNADARHVGIDGVNTSKIIAYAGRDASGKYASKQFGKVFKSNKKTRIPNYDVGL